MKNIDTKDRTKDELLFLEHYTDETEKKIIRRICAMFQISEEPLCSQSRKRKHIKAREAVGYLLKELTSLSLSEIGKTIGRNHSTVDSTLKKVRLRMVEDDFFKVFIHKQIKIFHEQNEDKLDSNKMSEQKKNVIF